MKCKDPPPLPPIPKQTLSKINKDDCMAINMISKHTKITRYDFSEIFIQKV